MFGHEQDPVGAEHHVPTSHFRRPPLPMSQSQSMPIEIHDQSGRKSAYSFRHARISELLQIYGVDPLAVAAQTGTSIAMIEKAYLRFVLSAMHEKLAALKG